MIPCPDHNMNGISAATAKLLRVYFRTTHPVGERQSSIRETKAWVVSQEWSITCHSRESGNPCARKVDSRLRGDDITDCGVGIGMQHP
jgi:hypothetical protein